MPDRTEDLARAFRHTVLDHAHSCDVLARAIEQAAISNLAQAVIICAMIAEFDTADSEQMRAVAGTIANAIELAKTHALVSPLNDTQIAALPERVLQLSPEPIRVYLAEFLTI